MYRGVKTIISTLKNEKVKLYLIKKGIKSLFLVWSFSTGKETKKSDVDIVYEKSNPETFDFFDRLDVQDYLEKQLKRPVDMISPTYVKSPIKQSLMKSKIQIF